MHVGAAAWQAPRLAVGAARRRRVDDQTRAIEREPNELALGSGLPATSAGAHGNVIAQDDTSESQLIARWRNLARSPMSMPVEVAIDSIGVLMRSSGE